MLQLKSEKNTRCILESLVSHAEDSTDWPMWMPILEAHGLSISEGRVLRVVRIFFLGFRV